jgi:Lrp/AsnC family leucine-responsive transcriptional regulator
MGSNYTIPNLDKKILSILHENSRISYTDISKQLDLSRVAIQTRINSLIEQGVIEKFTTVINPAKIGIHVSAFFNVEVEPQYLNLVAEQLANDPAVTSLYHMTGPSKLHMHGIFANNRDKEW